MAEKLDPRLIAAALNAQQQQQNMWNPVLGFLVPLWAQLMAAVVREDGLPYAPDAQAELVGTTWSLANKALAVLGFEYIHPAGCRAIDKEPAA